MSLIKKILAQTSAYLSVFPHERERLVHLLNHIAADPAAVFDRQTMDGHITASAFVLNPARDSVLLIHDKETVQWLLPGGHHEGDLSLQAAAFRGLAEQVGITGPRILPIYGQIDIPLDIDTHLIVARPSQNESEHRHYDFSYLGQATSDEVPPSDEDNICTAMYVPLDQVAKVTNNERLGLLACKAMSLFSA